MRGRTMAAIGAVAIALFVLQETFQSDDPGLAGIIADLAFFGFVFCVLLLGVGVARALAHRFGEREDAG